MTFGTGRALGKSPSTHVMAEITIDLCGTDKSDGCTTTIDLIPDDVLLEIFDSCRISEIYSSYSFQRRWNSAWERPVHVCQRWRRLIFSSPRRLRLQLCCTYKTPVRQYLDLWPAFPMFVDYGLGMHMHHDDENNAFAALEHSNRIYGLDLFVTCRQVKKLATVMQRPFPALKSLVLRSDLYEPLMFLPGGFLGRSAPSLQKLILEAISFPSLPALLLSAHDLVTLELSEIPPNSYISNWMMVTGMTALTKLRSLSIAFSDHPIPRHERNRHSCIQTVLPALTSFRFRGFSDYLEDLVARIACPRLNSIDIKYFWHRDVKFHVSQLFGFVSRLEDPRLTHFGWADVCSFFFCRYLPQIFSRTQIGKHNLYNVSGHGMARFTHRAGVPLLLPYALRRAPPQYIHPSSRFKIRLQ